MAAALHRPRMITDRDKVFAGPEVRGGFIEIRGTPRSLLAARAPWYRLGSEVLADEVPQSLSSILGQDRAVVTAFGAPCVTVMGYCIAGGPMPPEQF